MTRELKKYICRRCKYEWTPRKSKVRACPNCKRYDWNEEKK